jgi:hypothetical protein
MDTPRNTLTFCAQQAKCFWKNILRNNSKPSARIIPHVLGGLCCRICNKCALTQRYELLRDVGMPSWAPLHALHSGTPAPRGMQQTTHAWDASWTQDGYGKPMQNSGAMRLETTEVAVPVIWIVSEQDREICTVLGDVTMGYRTDQRPLTCTARSSERLVYNYTT